MVIAAAQATAQVRSYFSTNAAPAVLFFGTVAVWLTVEVIKSTATRPDAQVADRGSRPVIRVLGAAGLVFAAISRSAFPWARIPHPAVVFAIGLGLLWTGLAVRFWAFRTLGPLFTFHVMTSEDQPVVTSGPYRLLRHPAYAGIGLAMAGIGLVYDNWLGLMVLVTLSSTALVYRILVEERALEAALGQAYRSYAAAHKRLVPFVW